jgi:glycosyltransferase involved in cell wall biosynthesis
MPLKIVGDGPLADLVSQACSRHSSIEWLGRQAPTEVRELMGQARAVLVPSVWYEPFGLVAIEAFAKGTPVIATDRGALPEIVEPGRTGLVHKADPDKLVESVRWAWRHQDEIARMGVQARRTYEERYTGQHNYRQLMEIYSCVAGRWVGK